ncbi:hypothetical protein ACFQJC_03750 [Haloferax namakaokahaiae]|uniref:Ig-like domain-containing protein n=1 Tax=Haloferax namakaokahaiae TaxID=1748331 RepID=A0ABD5ZBE7_9EURY
MNRRALLTLLAAGATGLAGCGTPSGETDTPTPELGTREETATPQEERIRQQFTLWNPTPDPVFVTSVGIRDERDVFFENADLLPGERRDRWVSVPDADLEVLIETDTGLRTSSTWTVDPLLDGFEVVVERDAVAFWHRVSCSPTDGCALDTGGEADDLPLVGDGQSRWYAPAGVVIENSGPATEIRLAIDWYDNQILDRSYRLPAGTRLGVPVTYRTGIYRVVVETDEQTIDTRWPVPDEPTKYVDVGTGSVGCGPANSTLTVANRDDVPHRITIEIERETEDGGETEDDEETVEESLDLEPGEVQSLVPVTTSGRYEVFARLENGSELSGTWWSCPPRGPAALVIDATGNVTLSVAGPQPG